MLIRTKIDSMGLNICAPAVSLNKFCGQTLNHWQLLMGHAAKGGKQPAIFSIANFLVKDLSYEKYLWQVRVEFTEEHFLTKKVKITTGMHDL